MVANLTAQDIARRIQRPDEPLSVAVDRFRNWTKMGIIKPVGEKHPGSGRKKRYTNDALLRAVILETLTSATGSPATAVGKSLGRLAEEFRKLAEHGSTKNLIVINRPRDSNELQVEVVAHNNLGKHILQSNVGVHVIFNLSQYYSLLKDVVRHPYFRFARRPSAGDTHQKS
jgi:hypothetical protein